MTCCYEKPVWKTCDLAGKDKVFDLSYDVLIVAVGISLLTSYVQGVHSLRTLCLEVQALESMRVATIAESGLAERSTCFLKLTEGAHCVGAGVLA